MAEVDERLESATEAAQEHEERRSLHGDAAQEQEQVNNAEREENDQLPRFTTQASRGSTHEYREEDEGLTPSARSVFWASVGDKRVEDTRRASREEQAKAFADYESRPDIESVESRLGRYHARPGEYSVRTKENGDTVPAEDPTDSKNNADTKPSSDVNLDS